MKNNLERWTINAFAKKNQKEEGFDKNGGEGFIPNSGDDSAGDEEDEDQNINWMWST